MNKNILILFFLLSINAISQPYRFNSLLTSQSQADFTLEFEDRLHYLLAFGQSQYNPNMWNANGKTVFTAMGNIENDYIQYMILYDHATQSILQTADWGNYTTNDYHSSGMPIVLPSGKILTVTDNDHNTSLAVKRSLTAGNILTYEDLTDITGSQPSYMNPVLIGTTVHFVGRGAYNRLLTCKSTDEGTTISTARRIAELETTTTTVYPKLIYSKNKDKIKVIINEADGAGGAYSAAYYLESTDGDTWSNIDGTYSKNNASDYTTSAQLDANHYIGEVGLIGSACELDDNDVLFHTDNKIWYSNGNTWASRDLIHPSIQSFDTGGKSFLTRTNTGHFLICRALDANGNYAIVKLETTNAFQTFNLSFISNESLFSPIVAFNYAETEQSIIAALERTFLGTANGADPINSYSNIKIFKNF